MWYMISAAQLEQYLDENRWIYLVDMRDPASYARSHIRGAVNIPDEKSWGRVGELPLDRFIIAARQLARYGYQVADICGGIEAYRGKYLVR